MKGYEELLEEYKESKYYNADIKIYKNVLDEMKQKK